jgi:lysyl-tRNA synthetase class 2
LNAFLIVTLVGWANDHGFDAISLNFSPGARWLASGSPRTVANRIVIGLLRALQRFAGFQLDSLFRFNQHFGPRWQPRYVIVDRFRDLPRVTIAAMAAERYLPFAEILRGRERADRGAVEDSTLVAR